MPPIHRREDMAYLEDFKAGDTIVLEGERINGYGHDWMLVVESVDWGNFDSEFESAPDMIFTNGYKFMGDTLYANKFGTGRRVGKFFYGFIKQ